MSDDLRCRSDVRLTQWGCHELWLGCFKFLCSMIQPWDDYKTHLFRGLWEKKALKSSLIFRWITLKTILIISSCICKLLITWSSLSYWVLVISSWVRWRSRALRFMHGLLYTWTVQLLRFFESHRVLKISKNHSNTIWTSLKVILILKIWRV